MFVVGGREGGWQAERCCSHTEVASLRHRLLGLLLLTAAWCRHLLVARRVQLAAKQLTHDATHCWRLGASSPPPPPSHIHNSNSLPQPPPPLLSRGVAPGLDIMIMCKPSLHSHESRALQRGWGVYKWHRNFPRLRT